MQLHSCSRNIHHPSAFLLPADSAILANSIAKTPVTKVAPTPLRVLNVIESFGTGATETWLMNVVEQARWVDPSIHWSFYSILTEPGRNDARVTHAGGEVHASPYTISGMHRFMLALRRFVKQGRFDIVHCQHDFLSALYLLSISGVACGKRIVHVHNTDDWLPMSPWKRRLLLEPFRSYCLRAADHIVGVSSFALDHFLRFQARRPRRDQVLYCGVDLATIRRTSFAPTAFRRELGFPEDAKIVLFLGRMVPLKNPIYAFEVMRHLTEMNSQVVGLFAGDGGLLQDVQNCVTHSGLSNRIKLLGWRDDVARLMTNSDLLVFPRLEAPREALGLAVVEAQACGLPVLTSPGVTDDAKVVESLVEVRPLEDGPQAWASYAQRIINQPIESREQCLERVANSPFEIENSARNLIALYRQ